MSSATAVPSFKTRTPSPTGFQAGQGNDDSVPTDGGAEASPTASPTPSPDSPSPSPTSPTAASPTASPTPSPTSPTVTATPTPTPVSINTPVPTTTPIVAPPISGASPTQIIVSPDAPSQNGGAPATTFRDPGSGALPIPLSLPQILPTTFNGNNPLSLPGLISLTLPPGLLSLTLPHLTLFPTLSGSAPLSQPTSSAFARSRRPSPTDSVGSPGGQPSATGSQSAPGGRQSDAARRVHMSGIVTGVVVLSMILLLILLVLKPSFFRRRKRPEPRDVQSWAVASSHRTSTMSEDSMDKPPIEYEASDDGRSEMTETPPFRTPPFVHVQPEYLYPSLPPASSMYPPISDMFQAQPPFQANPPTPLSRSGSSLTRNNSAVFSSSQSFHVEMPGSPSSRFDGAFPTTPPMQTPIQSPTIGGMYTNGMWAAMLASPATMPKGRTIPGMVVSETEHSGDVSEVVLSGYTEAGFLSPVLDSGVRSPAFGSPNPEDDSLSIYSQQTTASNWPESTKAVLYKRANASRVVVAGSDEVGQTF